MVTQSGPKNPNWRGGRSVASNGYVLVRRPSHPRADCRGYVYEHILVAEMKLGRALRPGEEPHHKNRNRADNRPSNIVVTGSRAEHGVLHRKPESNRQLPGEPNPIIPCQCGCGQTFPRFDKYKRPRQFVSGHNVHHGEDGRWQV